MTEIKRRGLLAGAVLGGAALGSGALSSAVRAASSDQGGCRPPYGPITITPDDSRYESMLRGYNHRFVAHPDYVRVVTTTDQVVDAVREAVRARKRLVVRGGGHCFEDFTASPDVEVLLDMSQMTGVSYDRRRHAFAIDAGATLGHLYRTLFKGWGLTIPAGACAEVGAGGHICGGGYGPLSRTHGLVVDHLYAVEVVIVDRSGEPRVVVATQEPDDPHRDLWWAHTGGGGGNFGVVTRYWLRRPGAAPSDSAEALPKALAAMRIAGAIWPWERMTETSFGTLLRNFGAWCEANSAPDSPSRRLFNVLELTHRSASGLFLGAIIDDQARDADALVSAYQAAIGSGVEVEPMRTTQVKPWLEFTMTPPAGSTGTGELSRFKTKGANLRAGFTERQIAAIYRHLSDPDYGNPSAHLLLVGYGGRVNAVAPHVTATADRDSILKLEYSASWATAAEDAVNLSWLRDFYRDVYADTGGVPGLDDNSSGSYINYPDVDLADPEWNTSGVPWQTLYYKGNYPRLQRLKRRYDPGNVFHHALSIEPPAVSRRTPDGSGVGGDVPRLH